MTWSIHKETDDTIFIIDNDDGRTVTNDAERVVFELWNQYGDRRIVYRDTMGNWDELVHDEGVFKRYAPYKEAAP
jgi:hypothetical protein